MSDAHMNEANDGSEFVTFFVGEQEYCIDIMSLREIRGWTPATALPDAPHYVRGVINLRGSVLPIIDLAKRLDLVPEEPSERSVVMITQIGEQVVGLLADAVSDILTIDPSTIQSTPEMSQDSSFSFVKGLLAMEDRMISVIALESIIGNVTKVAA
jgi:purine-binding chemotaxis protein CheW